MVIIIIMPSTFNSLTVCYVFGMKRHLVQPACRSLSLHVQSNAERHVRQPRFCPVQRVGTKR